MIEAGSIEAGDVGSVTGLLETVLDRAAAGERWCNLTLEIDEDRAPASGDSVLFSFLWLMNRATSPPETMAPTMTPKAPMRPRRVARSIVFLSPELLCAQPLSVRSRAIFNGMPGAPGRLRSQLTC